MPDVFHKPGSGVVINNGSIVVGAQKTGKVSIRYPDINEYVPSGTMLTRWDDRFDEYYGGPPSGV